MNFLRRYNFPFSGFLRNHFLALRFAFFSGLCLTVAVGCTTAKTSNTSRTSTEQLLISNSVDQTLEKIDFRPFQGQHVFVDEKYLDGVDQKYVAGSVRHRVVQAGGRLVPKPDAADVIVEVRSGGIGTSMKESYVGIPKLSLPGPMPLSIPEIRLLNKTSQVGTAKIGILAYDAKTKAPLGPGGLAMAQSDDNNWFVLGIGPFQNGSVRREMSRGISEPARGPEIPHSVAFLPTEKNRYNVSHEKQIKQTGSQEWSEKPNRSLFER